MSAATVDEVQIKETISRYAAGIEAVDEALAGLTEADLDLAREAGKWTIREIVHHIADAETLWQVAIKSALGNCGCLFDASWYILDNKWAGPLQYATRPVDEALDLFRAIRHEILGLLAHVPAAWTKYVLFCQGNPDAAREWTVGRIVSWQARHVLIHVEQIRETRAVHNK
jgi:hypothetical protein